MRWLLPAALTVPCLLSACREDAPKPYEGKSAHWNQQAVPISLQCAACHRREFEEWASSDHAWAWRSLLPSLDSEAFHGQKLRAHGAELTFHTNRQGDRLLHDSSTGKDYRVRAVLGRTPLIQYLVEGDNGEWHTPSAAWDVTRHEWFDIFEDDERLRSAGLASRQTGDWGHWLGRGMNWNSQCAWCHMSGFHKKYNEKDDSFASEWSEPGVTCIQCHRLAEHPDPQDGCMVAKAQRRLTPEQNHDNCASCHARREELDDSFRAGESFHQHFRLELPAMEGIFWPNGMQRDEDYCETGLRLSRMGQAGVTCTDCHDPHTARLKLPEEEGALCLRCHAGGTQVGGIAAPVIDPATHTPCPPGSQGATCVDCHMPESPYMARDPRRDHSFHLPDPSLAQELGLPNVCTNCHRDKPSDWAPRAVEAHYPDGKAAALRPRTRAVDAAMKGQANAAELLAVCRAETHPVWKAVMLELLARQSRLADSPSETSTPLSSSLLEEAGKAAQDSHPLLRAAAARVSGIQAQRLLHDSSRLVRHAAGWRLLLHPSGSSLSSPLVLPPPLLEEMKGTAHHQADQPTGAMQLALLADAQHHPEEAERHYRRAIALDPASPVARMDLAVFLARRNRPLDALSEMLHCARVAPHHPTVQYRLGLILAETGQYDAALRALDKALKLRPLFPEARETRLQILLHLGRTEEARQEKKLLRALQAAPFPTP